MAVDQDLPDLPSISSSGSRPSVDDGGLPELPGYDILGEVGRGAMGIVYKARQKHPSRIVALKVMHTRRADSVDQRERFAREAQTVADLSHPGIVTLHEFGEVEGRPFFSMEFVEGQPIDGYARDKGLPLREKLSLIQRVCAAAAYAHLKGVVHRDLKPGNILVNEEGEPKILDFGLAKLTGVTDRASLRALTVDGQVLGTVPYMAPEQTLGQSSSVDMRTDVYALGVILYELVTGRLPHEPNGSPALELMRRIREEPPNPPSAITRLADDELNAIILMALEKERKCRYQSAHALAADLARYLAGEPIEAKHANGLYHVRKLVRRYRAVLSAAALAVLAAVCASVVASRSGGNTQGETAPVSVLPPPSEREGIELNSRGFYEKKFTNGHLMVWIPPGPFPYRGHLVRLHGYWIDKFEVSNKQFRTFLEAHDATGEVRGGHAALLKFSRNEGVDYPARGVHFGLARSYANWLGMRLPTEQEWQKAACGERDATEWTYPWGRGPRTPARCNTNAQDDGYTKTAPVHAFPLGQSPYGCFNMVGNVAEWTERSPDLQDTSKRALRGGHYMADWGMCNTVQRLIWPMGRGREVYGLRCVRDPKSTGMKSSHQGG